MITQNQRVLRIAGPTTMTALIVEQRRLDQVLLDKVLVLVAQILGHRVITTAFSKVCQKLTL